MTNLQLSRDRVLRMMLWAALSAAALLVLVVLPAEYGIDATGFGRLTGLKSLAEIKAAGANIAAGNAVAMPVNADAGGKPPSITVWSIAHSGKYLANTYEVPMKGDEEFEYKANVQRGEPLLYSWRVKEGSPVYFEFHGQPSEGTWPKDYYESYEKGESAGGSGSMIAPFTGEHGWYWLNLSDKPVTIVVELAGYYDKFGKYGEPPAP
jgi:hypothetical protein